MAGPGPLPISRVIWPISGRCRGGRFLLESYGCILFRSLGLCRITPLKDNVNQGCTCEVAGVSR